jgi:RNA polymerase sigma-70 factor (ECF subfamily)
MRQLGVDSASKELRQIDHSIWASRRIRLYAPTVSFPLARYKCVSSHTRVHRTDDRARWLAHNILPHEAALRAWLARRPIVGLEIDDIVQETYSRLSTATSVDGVTDPRSYMFQAAHSVILTHLRRSRVVEMHSFAHFDFETFVYDEPDPETVAADRDELSRLGRAIADLPPRMREVFVLRRVEGLSQRLVAERLGVSEKTVEKQMASGFQRLAEMFGRGGKRRAGASRQETERTDRPNGTGDKPGD